MMVIVEISVQMVYVIKRITIKTVLKNVIEVKNRIRNILNCSALGFMLYIVANIDDFTSLCSATEYKERKKMQCFLIMNTKLTYVTYDILRVLLRELRKRQYCSGRLQPFAVIIIRNYLLSFFSLTRY